MKCFYHGIDFDGICSAAIVYYLNPDVELYPIDHGDDFPIETLKWYGETETVFMVDYCLEPFTLMRLLDGKCSFYWIDHHKSAIEEYEKLGKYMAGIREIGKAACELTWEYLCPDREMPKVVELLGRYDVWDFSDWMTLPFQLGMRLRSDWRDPTNPIWRDLFDDEMDIMDIVSKGAIIEEYMKTENKILFERFGFEGKFGDYDAVFLNKGDGNSKSFDGFYDPEKHDIMVKFCMRPDARWGVTLYTTQEDVDCGAIAKEFGGGGHANAAGFIADELFFFKEGEKI